MRRRLALTGRPPRWVARCAALLLASLGLLAVHVTGPHYTAQCGCGTMLTLEAPAADESPRGVLLPASAPAGAAPDGEPPARRAGPALLHLLRSPPGTAEA